MTALAEPGLDYRPLHQSAPGWDETDGDIARRLAADLGWSLDPVQSWHVDQMLAVEGDLPACGEVCIVGPRQTVGKTVGLEVAALFDVLVAEVPLHVWTAHLYSTAEKTFLDMKGRLDRNPDYARRVEYRTGAGSMSINVDNGCRIEFAARSTRSGRGWTTNRITLDEWMFGRPTDLGALAPTIVTMDDAQIRYGSSAGMVESGELRRLRERGRRGGDPSLAYVELGAPLVGCAADDGIAPQQFSARRCRHDDADPGCALNDRRLYYLANSGLAYGRVPEANLLQQRRMLDPAEFAREFLSWWEDPPNEDGGAFDPQRWALLADPTATRGRASFGIAVAPDRSWSAIAAAWKRPDGFVQVSSIDYRPDAMWLADRVAELRRRWGGGVVVDTRAREMIPNADEPSETQQALAEAHLHDVYAAGRLRHGNEPELNTAARAAMWRKSGATRRLESSGTLDVSPLRAAALAVHRADSGADPLQSIW